MKVYLVSVEIYLQFVFLLIIIHQHFVGEKKYAKVILSNAKVMFTTTSGIPSQNTRRRRGGKIGESMIVQQLIRENQVQNSQDKLNEMCMLL